MDDIYIEKFKYLKWCVRDVDDLYEIGKCISTKTSASKETQIHECKEKKSGRAAIMKTIKRQKKPNMMKDICNQLFELYNLYEKMENKGNLGKIYCLDIELRKAEKEENDEIIIRIVIEKCNGSLKSFIQQNQKIKPGEFIEQVKYFSLMMFELEGRGYNHRNLTSNSIYYQFDSASRVVWKLFGFANFIWNTTDGSLLYASPEEKFLLSRFDPVSGNMNFAYELDYFKVDVYNLGITLLEMISMKEMQNWGFTLEAGDDPKRREEYINQASLNILITENADYLKFHKFFFELIRNMLHVNPRKRERFARVLTLLHDGLKLKLLAFQLDPAENVRLSRSESSPEQVAEMQLELQKSKEEIKRLQQQLEEERKMMMQHKFNMERMQSQVGVMQSTIRYNTEKKVQDELLKAKRRQEAEARIPQDTKQKKPLSVKRRK